jgi:hypothetical protein
MTALESANASVQPVDEAEPELLPKRRRRRLTTATALLAFAAVAAGAFVGGVEVQKHFGSTTASGSRSGSGSGLAALTGSSGSTGGFTRRFGGGTGSSSGGQRGSGGLGFGSGGAGLGGGGGFGAGSDTTAGLVTLIKGKTLYVTDFNGNTVKVTTKPGVRVSKTVTSSLRRVHPGDSVVVRGTQAKNGTLAASSIALANNGNG